jgi:hypothetical protein
LVELRGSMTRLEPDSLLQIDGVSVPRVPRLGRVAGARVQMGPSCGCAAVVPAESVACGHGPANVTGIPDSND